MWTLEDDGDERLEAKLRADLLDMAELKSAILDASQGVAQQEQAEVE